MTCTSQADCASGYTCQSQKIDSQRHYEKACLKKCASETDCPQGYTCCLASGGITTKICNLKYFPKRKNYCWPNYSRAYENRINNYIYTSCAALNSQGLACSKKSMGTYDVDTCGFYLVDSRRSNDALCSSLSDDQCVVGCLRDSNCIKGYKCLCPDGYSAIANAYYCTPNNTSNSYVYASKRCVK